MHRQGGRGGPSAVTPVVAEILMIVLAVAVTALITYHLVGFTDLLDSGPSAGVTVDHDERRHRITIGVAHMGNSDHVNVTVTTETAVASGKLTTTSSQLVVVADGPALEARGGAVAVDDWQPAPPGIGDAVEVQAVAVRKDRETIVALTEIDGL